MTASDTSIDWQEGQPFSRHYGDVYFSRDNGLEETQHVFLKHNHLEERWRELQAKHFTIAETGFGTGLNFISAWHLWQQVAPSDARLHFVSVEKHPLAQHDLEKALSLWPQLNKLSGQLLQRYRWLSPGFHRLEFGNVVLTLLIGDAIDMLSKLKASVDAWFLDGFSPAKNPDMWQPALFSHMARLSHSTTTFSTFTSAGFVKRGLQTAGFQVNKVSGHGRKREMLAGFFSVNSSRPAQKEDKRVIVIGGGIAGTSTSHAFAKRGWQVNLIDKHGKIAQEASGNPIGILYPRLAGQDIILSRLAQHGFLHSLRLIETLQLPEENFGACGLLQLAFDEREKARIHAITQRQLPQDLVRLLSADTATAASGSSINLEALSFPSGGWVNPVAFCQALALDIDPLAADITELKWEQGIWQAWQGDQLVADAPIVVIATANHSGNYAVTRHLPLQAVRGQLTLLPATSAGTRLRTVVCTDGYISPVIGNQQCLGATFDPEDDSLEPTQSDNQQNLQMLERSLPELHEAIMSELDMSQVHGRVAFRAATPDYLPMAGPILDAAALELRKPRHTDPASSLPWLVGLHTNTGHGSKGLINAPLCAEVLASAISGEPLPIDIQLAAALDPNRFALRDLGLKRLALGLAAYPS